MPGFKQLENFNLLKTVDSNSNLPLFSHKLTILEKTKTNSRWYAKCLDANVDELIREVIAQELLRLILPYHPKTRWIKEELELFDEVIPIY